MDNKAFFKEAKFGMMVHWGLYSLLGGEYRDTRALPGEAPADHLGEWIMNRKQIPIREYEKLAAAWNPETACKKRKEDFIYIGDSVMVARGRKIPQGTCGKVLRMFENPYDPVTYDLAKGALVLQTAGLDVLAIQYTNAKVQLELDNGSKVYTYLKNLEKTGGAI